MKKLLALLLACSTMTVVLAGCGSKKDKSSDKSSSSSVSESSEDSDSSEESESSSDSSSDSSSGSSVSTIEAGQVDTNLVGDWYSEEMGGNFCFDDDNRMLMSIDYSSIMYFDSNKTLMMSGVECPSTYDGTTLDVSIDSSVLNGTTAEGESSAEASTMSLMSLERKDAENADSIDGEYTLISGELYDELAASLYNGDAGTRISAIINGETLMLKMDICEYSADGATLSIINDEMNIFGFEEGEDTNCEYSISDDTLSLTASGETVDFTKVTE